MVHLIIESVARPSRGPRSGRTASRTKPEQSSIVQPSERSRYSASPVSATSANEISRGLLKDVNSVSRNRRTTLICRLHRPAYRFREQAPRALASGPSGRTSYHPEAWLLRLTKEALQAARSVPTHAEGRERQRHGPPAAQLG